MRTFLLAAVAWVCCALEARAQPNPDNLRAALDTAPAWDSSSAEPGMVAARDRLREQVNGLRAALAGTARQGLPSAVWLRESGIDELLVNDAPTVDDVAAVLHRLATDEPGLESPRLVAVRGAVRDYRASFSCADPATADEYQRRLLAIGAALDVWPAQPGSADYQRLHEPVAWLAQRGLAPKVVAEANELCRGPNVFVQCSARFLGLFTLDQVDRTGPVSDVLAGTYIVGTSHTVGTSRVLPVSDARGPAFEVVMRGTATSQTRGFNGPVRLHSKGNSQLHGTKRILFSPEGLTALPAQASARTNAHSYGFSTKFRGRLLNRFVSRIAERVAVKKKADTDREASRKAERDLRTEIDEESVEELAQMNRDYQRRVRLPLLRRDAFPEVFQVRTTPTEVRATLKLAAAGDLAAPTAAPRLPSADICLALHESALNNLAATFLAGRTVNDQELIDLLPGTEEEPSEQPARPASDLIHVTLAAERPVSTLLDNHQIGITLRATRFIVDGRTYPPMNIMVCYRLERDGTTRRLALDGEPRIYPPRFEGSESPRYSFREATIRRLLQNRLKRDLPEVKSFETLEIPDDDMPPHPMRVDQLTSYGGWFTLALTRKN